MICFLDMKLFMADPVKANNLLVMARLRHERYPWQSVIIFNNPLGIKRTIIKVYPFNASIELRSWRLELLKGLIEIIVFLHE